MSNPTEKTVKIGATVLEGFRAAAQREADRSHNGNFSAVIQAALREHLTRTGALSPSAEDRATEALRGLIQAKGPEAAADIIEGQLAAAVAA